MSGKAGIVILDGWGIGKHDKSDAVWNAETPFTDSLSTMYAHTTLRTDGLNVGLPEGQMGNSEVGHMNIGAGRIVWQMLVRINEAFSKKNIRDNAVWQKLISDASGKKLHLVGLVSDGGVHSHIDHLIQLCNEASESGVERVYIHAFLDGRDTDPKSGEGYLNKLLSGIEKTNVKISTVVGRYYGMDRDKRWERVSKVWNLMVKGEGQQTNSAVDAVVEQYNKGITDEFMSPLRVLEGDEGLIEDGDAVLCFNFRTDRGRQITEALSQRDFPDFGMHSLNLNYYTMTRYDESFRINGVLFDNQDLGNTLGEVISKAGKTQLRAAETEKYPHVSFFFSGGREEPFTGEQRLLVNSPKVATYDLQPSMSAAELTDKACSIIAGEKPDFICLNYANPDMVGHTGVYSAVVEAVETVDNCLQRLAAVLLENGYEFLVIADHGNADFVINEDGTPNTAHTTNPVPCWLLSKHRKPELNSGILADVAPTVLKLMEIKQPAEMTGNSLF